MDSIITKLPELLTSVMSMGWPGVIGAALLAIALIWASIKYKELAKEAEAAQKQSDQAANPGRASTADQDAATAQASVEEKINGSGR